MRADSSPGAHIARWVTADPHGTVYGWPVSEVGLTVVQPAQGPTELGTPCGRRSGGRGRRPMLTLARALGVGAAGARFVSGPQ